MLKERSWGSPGPVALGLLVFFGLAGGISGCARESTLGENALAPVRIGVITSLSGDLESLGPSWEQAARLAAVEANGAGGPLPGRLVEVIVADDQTDMDVGRAEAERLINEEGVVGIVGAAASSVTLQVAEVASNARVPQVSCCSTSPSLTTYAESLGESDRFFFRTAPPDDLQAQVLVDEVVRRGCTRIGILHLDDTYGEPLGTGVEAAFTAAGRTVTTRIEFANGRASYSDQVQALADSNPECIALIAYPQSGATIVREWNLLAAPPAVSFWIGTDAIKSDGFAEQVVNTMQIDGFVGTAPITDPGTPQNNAFRARYAAVFGQEPQVFGSNQYDAMALMMLAIAEAGQVTGGQITGDAIRDALRVVANDTGSRVIGAMQLAEGFQRIRDGMGFDYEGASGRVDFDALGNVVTDYEIWRFNAGAGGMGGEFIEERRISAGDL